MKKMMMLVCALMCFGAGFVSAASSKPIKEKISAETVSVSKPTIKWEFYSAQEEPAPEQLEQTASSSRFGKRVAYFYDLFKEVYVVKEEVVPGDPTRRTVIRKPEIYNAVRHIEKALNKAVKNKSLSAEESETAFCHVLKVSLAAIDSDSGSFEESLNENRKDAAKLLTLFQQVALKSIY